MSTSELLTVDDIAAELKISKSVVYQLIRNGELDAVNLAPNAGKILKKGHYRIQRESLNNYPQAKRIFSSAWQVYFPASGTAFASGEELSWIIRFLTLLTTLSVCSETSWTYTDAIFKSAWPNNL